MNNFLIESSFKNNSVLIELNNEGKRNIRKVCFKSIYALSIMVYKYLKSTRELKIRCLLVVKAKAKSK